MSGTNLNVHQWVINHSDQINEPLSWTEKTAHFVNESFRVVLGNESTEIQMEWSINKIKKKLLVYNEAWKIQSSDVQMNYVPNCK